MRLPGGGWIDMAGMEAEDRRRQRCFYLGIGMFVLACVLALAALNSGCATLSGARTDTISDDCRYYDDSYLAWKAVGYVGSGLGVASGTGTALVEGLDADDAEWWALGLGISGGVWAVLGGLGIYMAAEYAERYAEHCGELPTPEPVPDPVPAEGGP